MIADSARIGRFVFQGRGSARFILDELYAAHNLRERLLWPVHRWTGGRWLAAHGDADADVGDSPLLDRELMAEVLRAVVSRDEAGTSWIYERDYAQSRRGRAVLFVLAGAARQPVAVIKCGAATTAAPLGRERDVLLGLRARLPTSLAATLPEPVAYRVGGGREALALRALPGRSAYVELQTRLRPALGIRGHMGAAAGWLARFHDATARGHGRLKAVTRHGDFWARNLLVAPRPGGVEATGVVDWEHARDDASPFDDLFHFTSAYGVSYPWRWYRRLPAEAALRLTFLARTPLSVEVRRCIHRYCELRGIDRALVDPLFRAWVLERTHDAPQKESWCRFHETLTITDRCVFSG